MFFKEILFGFKHKSDFKKRAELDFSKCCQKMNSIVFVCLICGLLREISISIENLNVDQTKYVTPPSNELEWECFFQSFRQDFNFQETSDKLSEANFRNYIYFSACFQNIE